MLSIRDSFSITSRTTSEGVTHVKIGNLLEKFKNWYIKHTDYTIGYPISKT